MKRPGHLALDLEASTLGELREVVAALADWPADAELRVRTRLGANGHGAKLRRVVVEQRAQG